MIDGSKLQTLLLMFFGIVVLGVAVAVAATSKKAQYHETARVGVNVVVAIVLAAIGLGALGVATFGGQILDSIGISTSDDGRPDGEGE